MIVHVHVSTSYISLAVQMQENMQRATHRDAVNKGMFYFRHQLVPEDDDKDNEEEEEGQGGAKAASQSGSATKSHDDEYTQMSINTIMNGKVKTSHMTTCDKSHEEVSY